MMGPAKLAAPNGLSKLVIACLATALVTGGGSWLAIGRSIVTKEDIERTMPGLIIQYSPYTKDARDISTQLQALHDEQVRQGQQIQQIAVDVGRISEKAGVTAHPSGDGRNR